MACSAVEAAPTTAVCGLFTDPASGALGAKNSGSPSISIPSLRVAHLLQPLAHGHSEPGIVIELADRCCEAHRVLVLLRLLQLLRVWAEHAGVCLQCVLDDVLQRVAPARIAYAFAVVPSLLGVGAARGLLASYHAQARSCAAGHVGAKAECALSAVHEIGGGVGAVVS